MSKTPQEVALQLHSQGYTPIRIDPDSKAARHNGWQVETPTEDSIRRDFARPSNLGVRCGDITKDGTCLLGIDIDIEEGELIRCVERALGDDLPRIPVKKGKKGATYLIRYDREQKTTKLKWERDKKKIDAIDILCKSSQTVIPPSIHPDTQLPYEYIAGPHLEDVNYRSLPVFGPALLDEIRGFCKNPEDPIYALNDMVWAGVGGGGNTHDTCVRAVSSMVARNWTDEEILERLQRAKREACEAASSPYHWPDAIKAIQEWIDSSRSKKFDTTSRAGKARPDDIPVEILNNYVYIQHLDRIYDLTTGMLINKQVFDNIHARDLVKPWTTLMTHPDFKLVHRMTYAPGEPQFCKEMSLNHGAVHNCLNMYRPSGVEPEEGDVEPFLKLVRYIFDENEEAIKHVLGFFGHMVQFPGQRINHGLVIQGEQGIGKDTILTAVGRVLGEQNYSQVTLNDVESDFNDWILGKQLIVFQEMMAAGRRHIYNKLKILITEMYVSVNEKHLARQRMPNRAAYVFLTNYKHALSIDPDDRRTWVWYSQAHPQPRSFFDEFYTWLADTRNISALMHYLLNLDISYFKPYEAPPMTEAKRSLIETSASEIEQFLRQSIESGTWPMGCDLINLQHLHSSLRGFSRMSISMLQEALENLGAKKLENRPRMGGARLQVWAIRNWEVHKDLSAKQLAAMYRIPLPPQQGESEGSYSVYNGASISEDTKDDAF